MREKSPSSSIQEFSHELSVFSNSKNILLVDATGDFNNLNKKKTEEYDLYEKWFPASLDSLDKYLDIDISHASNQHWEFYMTEGSEFDLIFANFPIGIHKNPNKIFDPEGSLWGRVASYLSPTGKAVFLVNEHLSSKMEEGFKHNKIYVEAIINAPETFLKHLMGVSLNIVIVGNKPVKKVFYSELPSNNEKYDIIYNTTHNFLKKKDTGSLETGTFLKGHKFTSFRSLRATFQVEKFESIYKDFKAYSIEDLAVKEDSVVKVNAGSTGITFTEINNSVYIPRIGNGPVLCSINDLTMKHQNYHQVCLNDLSLIHISEPTRPY